MSTTTASGQSHTLIVFGGSQLDVALATDFVAISKKFIADGMRPTCMAGTHLRDVMAVIGFPLIFWREDFGRKKVYDKPEAENSFYQLAGPNGFKHDVFDSVSNVAAGLSPGDRVIIILICHGQGQNKTVSFTTRGRNEYLAPKSCSHHCALCPKSPHYNCK